MPTEEVRAARIAIGTCVYGCGERRGVGLACQRCAEAHARREARRRADLRQARICLDCARAIVAPGLYRWPKCLEAQRQRMRASGPDAPGT